MDAAGVTPATKDPVGGRIERGHHGPATLAQHPRGATGPLHQALHPAEGAGQVLLAVRGELGRRRRCLGIERLERGVQLALLLLADAQALRRRAAPSQQLGELDPGQVAPHGQELGRHAVVGTGGGGLTFERSDLALYLPHQVTETFEVLFGGGQAALGAFPPATEATPGGECS